MSDLFTLNEKIKLRSDNWKALECVFDSTNDYEVGDVVITENYLIGVAATDTLAEEKGVLIYAAEKIILPCDLDGNVAAGSFVGINEDGEVVDVVDVSSDATFIIGIALEDTASSATEILIDMFDIKLPIGDNGS